MSEAEQKEAIAARGRAKASITRLKNSLDREALINSPIELVTVKRARLLDAFSDYERLTSKVASLFSSPPATLASDDEEVEDNYILLVAQLDSIINVIRQRDNPQVNATSSSATGVSVKSENLKLPRIVIKTFTVVKQHLAALRNLGEPVDKWDAIIICILSKKIDLPTYRAFQLERNNNESPTILLTQPESNNGNLATFQPTVTAGSASTLAPSITTSSAATTSTSIACAATSQGPTLVQTAFGVIIAGRTQLPARNSDQVTSLFCSKCNDNLSEQLSAFWETEKVPEIFPEKLPEQDYCEKLFRETTKLVDNKYEVSLPTKVPLEQINSELGESFHLALNRFLNLEKRLHMPKNQALFTEYKKFIDQYVDLNHGEYIDINKYDLTKDPVNFVPHHPVIRLEARTTKLRCVFDASMRTNKKVSLNDMLLNGPVVQRDLFDILILFRADKLFFICDKINVPLC
ncbi:uncharacterized protein LOC133533283 isoform X2 [Cydia pomonella]|uniref:uncharacterized protein LOC133533283 isoform X2 n=1 Tax=Cydia pomonella TaxID=82600 RepID=UPI002ADD64D8|nr:uncharacterized protein LOC133533283 isoform X2 [Cydia pomonella]